MYFVKNYQKIQIKQWSNIDPTEGNLPVLVDDTWRLNSSEATNYDCLVYIVPTQVDPLKEMNNMFSDYPTAISFHVARKVNDTYIYIYLFCNSTPISVFF